MDTDRSSVIGGAVVVPFHMMQGPKEGGSSDNLVSALRRIKEKANEMQKAIKKSPPPRSSFSNKAKEDKENCGIASNRVDKMRDIKSEIGSLMTKIDSASR